MTKRGKPKAKQLEDYEPGATKAEIFQALNKAALYKNRSEGQQMATALIQQARPIRSKSTKILTPQNMAPQTPAAHISTQDMAAKEQTWTSTSHSSVTTLKSDPK